LNKISPFGRNDISVTIASMHKLAARWLIFPGLLDTEMTMDQKTEAEIIVRILNGDRQAYALLVDDYKVLIYNLAFRMTGSYQDADDLTQEAFIKAYDNLWRFDRKRKFFSWLYTISLNCIRNHLKKNKANLIIDPTKKNPYNQEEEQSPESQIMATQESNRIDSALLTLDQEIRGLLIMKYQLNLSFAEIAEIADKSISAVKMRIYRGLEQLKKLLTEDQM
jgi:RNA polymerase sigma-70 factor, ECF subfamily